MLHLYRLKSRSLPARIAQAGPESRLTNTALGR